LLAYDKLAGPAPRMLVLEGGYWLDTACITAAQSQNWEVHAVATPMKGHMPRDTIAELLHAVTAFRPDFILSINMTGMDEDGILARLFADLRIPYAAWFVDNPRTILAGRTVCDASDYLVALTWDKAYAHYLADAGFGLVETLPLAVDHTLFNAEPARAWTYPPTFVGNSMTFPVAEERAWFDAHPQLARAVDEALDAGAVTRHNFAKGLEAMLDPRFAAALDADQKRHAELFMFCEQTRRLRAEFVHTLAADGLHVRGDEAWKPLLPTAGGPVDYYHELPSFYRQCEVNLNTTSIQMPTAVNQRVLDCPAAGGFLLTDAQAALEDMFDVKREVACYSTLDECRHLLHAYRRNPGARRQITARARIRILGEHTYARRLQTIAAILKERFGA